jgi:hypothetical protein
MNDSDQEKRRDDNASKFSAHGAVLSALHVITAPECVLTLERSDALRVAAVGFREAPVVS